MKRLISNLHHLFVLSFFVSLLTGLNGQDARVPLSPVDYDKWEKIENETISNNGEIVVYSVVPGFGDPSVFIVDKNGEIALSHDRGINPTITADSRFVAFLVTPPLDSVRQLKRLKTKESDMPGDTLVIYDIRNDVLIKKENVKSFTVPDKWSGYLFYTLDEVNESQDSTVENSADTIHVKTPKKVGEDNGFHLVIRNLETSEEDTLLYVIDFSLARSAPSVVMQTSGTDSIYMEGIHHYDPASRDTRLLKQGKAEYKHLAMSEDGTKAAFLSHTGSKKAYVPKFELNYWQVEMDSAEVAVKSEDLDRDFVVSKHGQVTFSSDGDRIYFGVAEPPIVKDTTLLEDEIIQVEIWSHHDKRLHTQQEVEKERDEKKSYQSVYHTDQDRFVQLGSPESPEILFGEDHRKVHEYVFGRNVEPYRKAVSWEGYPLRQDIYKIDIKTGKRQMVAEGIRGSGDLSPGGEYLYWYNVEDTAYYAFNIRTEMITQITEYISTSIVDELDDHPDFPSPYGIAGWTADDESVLIYDRYDIWEVDPSNPEDAVMLTQGRSTKERYRIRKLDNERPHVEWNEDLLILFNESTKGEGLVRLTDERQVLRLLEGPYVVRDLQKAKAADQVIYSLQNHKTFPDLYSADSEFHNTHKISSANSYQKDRLWSSVELMSWTSLDGIELEGLLYKPEGFDSEKQYPMIVYFYERNSHTLHRYWGAYPHRSIINPSYYASRGYLVFIPDIVYKDGYPGPSCYNAVIPGVTKLIEQGFVDIKRIGMQGHSWGGYQTAYLATRTDLFACAESGAPVANMISAYGGIRWGTGLSRMFQYERTQSRIGGTLWDFPMRYFENSPIFFVDKINTPLLLMHNDHDTAVPWYQGIELFVALRRLDKSVWMLNYNDEPHWPTKRENIIDFNVRMQHFFDYYLMGQPMPIWMKEGVPAIRKGYYKGY